MFNIVIQAGAILAVTIIYWNRIIALLLGWRDPVNRDYIAKLFVAFLVTAVLGLIAKKLGFTLPDEITPVAWALVIGGIWMIGAESLAAGAPDRTRITWEGRHHRRHRPDRRRHFSRHVALGRDDLRRHARRHQQPLGGHRIFLPRRHPDHVCGKRCRTLRLAARRGGHEDWGGLGVAFVVSTITAFIAVKWLIGYIRTHRFTVFAIYRIIFGLGLLLSGPSARCEPPQAPPRPSPPGGARPAGGQVSFLVACSRSASMNASALHPASRARRKSACCVSGASPPIGGSRSRLVGKE